MNQRKRIGILTSGGDCPGLNCAIRAVVSHAKFSYDWEVVGIPYATQGLLERKAIALSMHGLDLRGIDPLLSMGGTILGSINKGDTLARADEIIASYQALELDALIAIGGDGSLSILHELARRGNWNLVAIPKTIDNDVACTHWSIGFDTAVNTIVDALTRLTFTAASHDRVMVVEVMGRTAGHLALHAGIAGGADCILIPEIPYSIEAVCRQINDLHDRWGRRFAIVVVAEGASGCLEDLELGALGTHSCAPLPHQSVGHQSIGQYIADRVADCSGRDIDIRVSVLGHIQRGGIPSALDRLLATAFGKAAVDLVAQEKYNQMVSWQDGRVVPVSISDIVAKSPVLVDPNSCLIETARGVGIYVGTPPTNERSEIGCTKLQLHQPCG
jgi:ATP-dependent phosphofructokinase / diphosphate-dependent phosphofructokinase